VELIGTVVGLQVQRSSLKLGERPHRWFDPAPLLAVPALLLDPDGVSGLLPGGEPVVDVHNRRHPETRHGTGNGVSVGFTTHYARMRARLGERAADGVAGENILIAGEPAFVAGDLPAALVFEGPDGSVRLEGMRVMEPCVEFSRWVLGYTGRPVADLTRPDPAVTPTLAFLRAGMRGYCGTCAAPSATLRLGDRVYAARGA
jgi:hypothetical protein